MRKSGEILGFGAIWIAVEDIHITNIVVKKNLRRKGIGKLLLDKLIEESQMLGFRVLTLEVSEKNLSAIKLYAKYGFETVGIRKNYYNDNENAIIMNKII